MQSISNALSGKDNEGKSTRALTVLVLSVVLLIFVYTMGSLGTHLQEVDEYRYRHHARIEALERDFDGLIGLMKTRTKQRWSRDNMRVWCDLAQKDNPGFKCPNVDTVPNADADDAYETFTRRPPIIRDGQPSGGKK